MSMLGPTLDLKDASRSVSVEAVSLTHDTMGNELRARIADNGCRHASFVYLVVVTPSTTPYTSAWKELLATTRPGGWCIARPLGGLSNPPADNCIGHSVPHLALFTSTSSDIVIEVSGSLMHKRSVDRSVSWPIVGHLGRIAYFNVSYRPSKGHGGKCRGCSRLLGLLTTHTAKVSQEACPSTSQPTSYATLMLLL